jgi:hypothetical protein
MTGRMIDAMLSEGGNHDSKTIAENALRGKQVCFRRRLPYGFKTPYGYARRITNTLGMTRIVPRTDEFRRHKTDHCELVPGDPAEVEIVKSIFMDFADGGIGLRALAANLNSRKIPSPTGGKWISQTLKAILTNEKYCGDLALGKRQAGDHFRIQSGEVRPTPVRAKKTDGAEFEIERDTHEPLISRELFVQVQHKLKRRFGTYCRNKNGGYALKDVLFCGHCGRALYGNRNANGNKKSGKTIYVCKSAIKWGKQCECGQWSIKEEEIMPFLKQKLVEQLDKTVLLENSVRARVAATMHDGTDKLKTLDRQLAEIEKRIKRGVERLLTVDTEFTADAQAQLDEWKKQRESVRAELAVYKPSNNETERLRRLRQACESAVTIQASSACDGKFSSGYTIPKEAFRELLTDNGCRVDIWWSRASQCRWQVARLRLTLRGESAALMANTVR